MLESTAKRIARVHQRLIDRLFARDLSNYYARARARAPLIKRGSSLRREIEFRFDPVARIARARGRRDEFDVRAGEIQRSRGE
jgi:predicted amidophosphoribosyltransferase